jgi:hypothetical protein
VQESLTTPHRVTVLDSGLAGSVNTRVTEFLVAGRAQ